jgi:hypothetical protein
VPPYVTPPAALPSPDVTAPVVRAEPEARPKPAPRPTLPQRPQARPAPPPINLLPFLAPRT